jgi:hypothetical protein
MVKDPQKALLNERYEGMAWGLFLVFLGVLWLIPEAALPGDAWLVGAGFILLALNVARYMSGIQPSIFTSILGGGAVLIGVAEIYAIRLPAFALVVIAAGAYLMIRPLVRREPTTA